MDKPSTSRAHLSRSCAVTAKSSVENIDDSDEFLEDSSTELLSDISMCSGDITSVSNREENSSSCEESEESVDPGSSRQLKYFSYGDNDGYSLPKIKFLPGRPPGVQLDILTRSGVQNYTRALDIFQLFFTPSLMKDICKFTNAYAKEGIKQNKSYANSNGEWDPVTPEDLMKFIGLIIYMGFVSVPTIPRYWSTKSLYHGLWARAFMTRKRFQALLAFLHIVDPSTEDEGDKLKKVKSTLQHFQDSCKTLYQGNKEVSIDERMVKNKSRSGIRQYMKNKPVKFGIKLWVLADSSNGYTMDFDIYTGAREDHSKNGLAYDVVMNLMSSIQNQGYELYLDNFYTSKQLLVDLIAKKTLACGTLRTNRKGFPDALKDTQWQKTAKEGDMRWVREDGILFVQWKDKQVVNIASSFHKGHGYTWATRNSKVKGQYRKQTLRKPRCVDDYNKYMGGVDRSDQLLNKYNVLIKSLRWWKTLFFHFIDIACVNSCIIFSKLRQQHSNIPELVRPVRYSHLEFREELCRQILKVDANDSEIPQHAENISLPSCSKYESDHIPEWVTSRKNCKICYKRDKKQIKTSIFCPNKHCNVFLCFQKDRNCFKIWHTSAGNAFH